MRRSPPVRMKPHLGPITPCFDLETPETPERGEESHATGEEQTGVLGQQRRFAES